MQPTTPGFSEGYVPEADITITSLGGFGDVVAGRCISEYLEEIGWPCRMIPVREEASDAALTLFRLTENNMASSHYRPSGRNVIIHSVAENSPGRIRKENILANIIMREYDRWDSKDDNNGRVNKDYSRQRITLLPGLGYDASIAAVQPGLFERRAFARTLESYDTAAMSDAGVARKRAEFLEGILMARGRKTEGVIPIAAEGRFLEGNISFYYHSVAANRGKFLMVLAEADRELRRPLTVLYANSDDAEKRRVMARAGEMGFGRLTLFDDVMDKRYMPAGRPDSKITIFDIGTQAEKLFWEAMALADSLSSITGDHSLSQMLQKAQSNNPVPFMYETAPWKRNLLRNLSAAIKVKSPEGAESLWDYLGLLNERDGLARGISRLLTDKDLGCEFVAAARNIPDVLLQKRLEAGIPEARTACKVTESLGLILHGLAQGMTPYEACRPLLPADQRYN